MPGSLLSLFLLLAACDPRHAVGVEGDQANTPETKDEAASTPDAGASKGAEIPTKAPPPPVDDCVVAVRLDDCCPAPQPVAASALGQDPCLVRYPFVHGFEPVPRECAERRPGFCAAPCDENQRAQSVFAERGEDGQCRFANECERDSDCQLAADVRSCCPCADAWPVRYVNEQRCVMPEGIGDPPPDCLPGACDPDVCPPCSTMGIRPKVPEAWCLKPPGIGPTQCAVR